MVRSLLDFPADDLPSRFADRIAFRFQVVKTLRSAFQLPDQAEPEQQS